MNVANLHKKPKLDAQTHSDIRRNVRGRVKKAGVQNLFKAGVTKDQRLQ